MSPDPYPRWSELAFDLTRVTEAGARTAAGWRGKGRPKDADGEAAEAMRAALDEVDAAGVVVCGEGEKDGVAHLAYDERFGDDGAPVDLDLAVDPIDGTTRLGMGLGGAISVLGVAPRGSLFDPGPAYYMEKLVAGPEAQGKLDPEAGTTERLRALAAALGKPVGDVTVFVLDKPRHVGLAAEIREAGARAAVYPAGDVEGVLRAVTPGSGIDALMGTGGTPEGLIAACAVRALGGVFYGRIDPQKPDETERVREAGISTEDWLTLSDIVDADHTAFSATGITTGPLLRGVDEGSGRTQTLLVIGRGARGGSRHVIESEYVRPAKR